MESGSGDQLTNEWAKAGRRPDLVGWKAIAYALDVDVRTAQRWELAGLIPVLLFGRAKVAAYRERLQACALRGRPAAEKRQAMQLSLGLEPAAA